MATSDDSEASMNAGRLADAAVLERAAVIMQTRSRKPRSIMLAALCRVLTTQAVQIRSEASSSKGARLGR